MTRDLRILSCNGLYWFLATDNLDEVGLIPSFVAADSPEPLERQIDENYGHGGGWRNIDTFRCDDRTAMTLDHDGDPTLFPVAIAYRGEETIAIYPYGIVAVWHDGKLQPHAVARID